MPSNALTFTTAEQLVLADEVIESEILRSILDVVQDYYTIPVDSSLVASQAAYPISSRAFSSIIREVQIIRDTRSIDLQRISLEDLHTSTEGDPKGFYLRQDKVILYPTPNASSHTLRLWLNIAPGKLVEASETAVISGIDTNLNTVTVSSIPSSWTTGDIFDFASQGGSHPYIAIDQTSTDVTGTVLTFASLPTDLSVGDYVMPQAQSSLIQLPTCYRSVLAQGLAASMLLHTNQPGASKAHERFKEKLGIAQGIIAQRVTGEVEDILPRNWNWYAR